MNSSSRRSLRIYTEENNRHFTLIIHRTESFPASSKHQTLERSSNARISYKGDGRPVYSQTYSSPSGSGPDWSRLAIGDGKLALKEGRPDPRDLVEAGVISADEVSTVLETDTDAIVLATLSADESCATEEGSAELEIDDSVLAGAAVLDEISLLVATAAFATAELVELAIAELAEDPVDAPVVFAGADEEALAVLATPFVAEALATPADAGDQNTAGVYTGIGSVVP